MIVIKKDATNVIVCEKCSTTIQYNKGDISLEYKPENGVFTPIIQCPVCKTNHQIKPKSFNGFLYLNNVSYGVLKTNKVLNDYTWQEISAISSSGKAEEYFKIHDQKEIVLKGGKTALVEIIGFNHDAENSITFSFVDLIGADKDNGKVMNDECTNVGGWADCKMRKYLKNSLLPKLPVELSAVIKEVEKTTSVGGGGNEIVTTLDKLFIPSEIEVFGQCYYSKNGEGKQYDGFKHWKDKVKGYSDSSYGRWWWLRSPISGYSYDFCMVDNNGYCNGISAYYSYGVAACFAI